MKRITSYTLAILLAFTSLFSVFTASAETGISTATQLANAFKNGGSYILNAGSLNVKNYSLEKDIALNGSGNTLKSSHPGAESMFYQNADITSTFSNIKIAGSAKREVGIWLGAGTMSFTDSSVSGFSINDIRCSAIAAGGSSRLVLTNTAFSGNQLYDIYLTDKAGVTLNEGTTLDGILIASNFIKINIGKNWSDDLVLTFEKPVAKVIGTVADGADISQITVTNDGYRVENKGGKLTLVSENESAVHFDMSGRQVLQKGSTGFLYGSAEINVPSIDLLTGLKPDTMVQKAYGGKQHPTGDAVRTSSALKASGVRDMQIYLQDYYLEWPYDAPMKDGEIDLDDYQRVVESILYKMICTETNEGNKSAFQGSDGKYYVLNSNKDNYSYVLFNEPDQIWYWGNLDGLKRAWKKIYIAVHNIDPDARCVGPNYSGFNGEQYDSFLAYCKDNNCLPEIISWHELGDISLTDFNDHYDAVLDMTKTYYTDGFKPQFMVNEYARHYDIGAAGGLVKWLAMFEDRDMSGCMAYWAMANTLNEMAADQNSPTSTWWVYHWYAQMTGEQCPLVSPEFSKTRFYGLTSYDSDINTAYALFGGSENQHDTEAVYLDNIDTTSLLNSNGAVHAKVYAVGFSGQLGANYKPEVVFDGDVGASENSVKLTAVGTDEMHAYFAVLTKPESDTEGSEGIFSLTAQSYEAENAELLGGATAYDKDGWATFATSGRADVGSINNNGDGVRFTVSVPSDGYYKASLFYSLQAPYVNPKTLTPDANGQNRGIGKALPYGIKVDGQRLDDITLESTVTWWYKNHADTVLYLTAGEHKIAYTHINGDEGSKGNLQLVAALDKLDIAPYDESDGDFEICLDEMENFRENGGYKLTAIAPCEGYYTVKADGSFTMEKQCVDYAKDAKSFSTCDVYFTPVGSTVYLAKGANTLFVTGDAGTLSFSYNGELTESASAVVGADKVTLHGNNPMRKKSTYAESGYVVSELGIGQSPADGETCAHNYMTFGVNVPKDGTYNLSIRYSNDEPAPIMLKADGSTYIHPYNIDLVERYAQIEVNGNEAETVYFKNTLSWDTFRTVNVQVVLNAGENTVKLYNDNSYQFSELVNSTAPEIDRVTVSKLSYDGDTAEFVRKGESKAHVFEGGTVTTPATTSKNGSRVSDLTCTECGYRTVKTEAIAKIKSVTLSASSYTFDGKAKKPTVTVKDANNKVVSKSFYTVTYSNNKNVGTATAKVVFKGDYSGTKSLSYKINPKGTALSKLTGGKKQFTATWKKQTTQTTGYELQYSTSSNFKGAKTVTVGSAKTVKKLVKSLKAKKTYYVRIRTYKTVKKQKYYSAWSNTKTVKTK